MKPRNSSITVWKTLVVAVALLALLGTAAGVQAASQPNQITVHSQDLNSGVIMVDSVTSPVDGWIVVYKDPNNLTPGQLVGYAPVHQGANSNVKVTIDTAKAGNLPTLWAVLQADGGTPGVFEWGLRGQPLSDAPVVENGHHIMTGFGTAAAQ